VRANRFPHDGDTLFILPLASTPASATRACATRSSPGRERTLADGTPPVTCSDARAPRGFPRQVGLQNGRLPEGKKKGEEHLTSASRDSAEARSMHITFPDPFRRSQ